ncbi:MAG: class I SAM-dependent methyltransferase [Defluviitaleaceae bacterium]|nr:class I SAM-dependent methyltransferase [Defluviitaleaceae bacterium]
MLNYTEINSKAISGWAEGGWVWGTPVSPEVCEGVRRGEWNVVLTPTRPVPKDWFLPFKGARVLGLASGGGQQMPVFALLGGSCTVMDYSDAQLESERLVAGREGYDIEVVKGDMTKVFPFADGSFDMIFHPVSNCYVEDVYHIWRECFRVLRPGGVLLSGLGNEILYLVDDENATPLTISNPLPWNPLINPAQMPKNPEQDSIQFSHSFDEQIGGQLKAGFVITAAFEDYCTDVQNEALKTIPAFWATRAVKPN